MMELTLRLQIPERVPNSDQELRLRIQAVVRRKDPLCRKGRHTLHGFRISLRVRGRTVGEQHVLVNQIPGKQIPPLPHSR